MIDTGAAAGFRMSEKLQLDSQTGNYYTENDKFAVFECFK